MKTITIILFTVILNACGSAKKVATNLDADGETSSKIIQTTQDETMTIEYKAVTRGSFKMVKVDSKAIQYQNSRADKIASKTCSKDDWSSVMKMTETMNLAELSKIEPPSKAHQYDGAAIASLTITKDGKTYRTQSFDGGNPPKEIADLVNTIIALGETEKTKGN